MKLGSVSSSNPLFFPKIVLVILVPLHFLWILELACHLVQRSQLGFWNKLHWISTSIWKVLLILTILSLPILRCGMSFHLCRPFFFQWCFIILVYKYYTFVTFIPECFILLMLLQLELFFLSFIYGLFTARILT